MRQSIARTTVLAAAALLIAAAAVSLSASAFPVTGTVSEIRLQRTACFGRCPVDEVVLRSDGTASYAAEQFTDQTGQFEGSLSPEVFARLAQVLQQERFFYLRDRYARPISDQPSVITTVTRAGQAKSVVDYGGAGPLRLWTVEQAIRGVASNIDWQAE